MKTILQITVLILTLYSCEYNVEEDTLLIDCSDKEISFIDTVKPIIENNCLGCHNGNQTPNLSTYENISENADKIKAETFSRRMPQDGTLTNDEIEAIFCWVESGALNN